MSAEHYADEQQNEIEILQSIYPTELVELSQDPRRFTLTIRIDDDGDGDFRPCTLDLTIEYTATYPDTLPEFTIDFAETGNDAPTGETEAEFNTQDMAYLTEKTRQMGEECLGMAMVFSMASDLKEAAMQRLIEKSVELRRLKEERIQREIEADQLKFIGTPVTRATFLEWRIRFDREMKDHAARLAGEAESGPGSRRLAAVSAGGAFSAAAAAARKDTSKLTGRQLFEQDKSLALSDSRFISEGDVSVDAATFVKEENVADLASE